MHIHEIINANKGKERNDIIIALSGASQETINELAEVLNCKYRTPLDVATAISNYQEPKEGCSGQKDEVSAEDVEPIYEESAKGEAEDVKKKDNKPQEPQLTSTNKGMFCICLLPTDVKEAIQKEMQRRAETNEILAEHLANVSYTDVFARIEEKLVKLAEESKNDMHKIDGVGVVGLHYSDTDTYNLAEFLILNQPTKAEMEEQKRKKDEQKAKADKAKSKGKSKKSTTSTTTKVVPLVPNTTTKTNAESAKADSGAEKKATQLSLFDF